MLKTINLIAVIIFSSCFLNACKKDLEIEVIDSLCNEQTTNHVKHQRYQAILDEYALKGIPGLSVVISKPGDATWSSAAGYSSIEESIKMTPCNLHHTASLVKSFVGVMTLQLIEEEKLALKTKVKDYLSEEVQSYTPNIDQLTIEHLLQQTSGIPDVFGIAFFSNLMNDPTKIYTREELLSYNNGVAELHNAGTEHYYSDHNYMLLSMIIDKVEGNHIASIQERIVEPLQLKDFHYHDQGFPYIDGVSASYWEQYENAKVENISDVQNLLSSYIVGSDGIIASPKAMTQFYQAVFSGNLINSSSLELIKSNWVKEKDDKRMNTAYSHGFMVIEAEDGDWIGHAGLQIGSSCYVFHNLKTEVTIGVFTNMGTFLSEKKKEIIYGELWNSLREVVN